MPGVYGGLVVIMIYAAAEQAVEQEFALITQNNLFIFTQLSQEILAQEP
jgi:acyl-CoA thioesterase